MDHFVPSNHREWVGALADGLTAVAIAHDRLFRGLRRLVARAHGALWWLIPTSVRLIGAVVFLAVASTVCAPWLGVRALMIVASRHSDVGFRSPSTLVAGVASWGIASGEAFGFDRV